MLKRMAAAAAVGLAGAMLMSASPAQAATDPPLFPRSGWVLQQIAMGDTGFSPAALSQIVDQDTVALIKPAGDTGTSIETADLGLPVTAGDTLTVQVSLLGSASADVGAVRMFVYDHPGANTLTEAPQAVAAAAGDGTLTLTVPFTGTIGTMGLVYDASNSSAGTVEFSNLRLNNTPIWFIEEQKPFVTWAMPTQCETLQLTFDNSGPYTDGIGHVGPWPMTFDYRLPGDQQLPLEAELEGLTISDPPLAGQPFDGLYHPVPVPAGESSTVELDVTNVPWVEYRLVRGAEQRLFFDWQRIDLAGEYGCTVDEGGDDGGDDGQAGGDDGDGKKPGLPATSGLTNLPVLLGAGGLLVLAGGGAVLLGRRRRGVSLD